jgi:segregation and condensation protein B
MNESHIRNVIEAALLAAGKPLQPAELIELFDEGARPQVQDIHAGLDILAAEYSSRGIEIKETAAGFRIQVRRELANEISRLWPERPARYSRALLETLALIAYRQPITRAEIEAVRGVAVNPNILKTVIERNWVRVVGHRDVPGRPELLGTTREFLDYFGLKSLDELPPLAELKVLGDIKLQFELPDAGPVGVPGIEAAAAVGGAEGVVGVVDAAVADAVSDAVEAAGEAVATASADIGNGAVNEGAGTEGHGNSGGDDGVVRTAAGPRDEAGRHGEGGSLPADAHVGVGAHDDARAHGEGASDGDAVAHDGVSDRRGGGYDDTHVRDESGSHDAGGRAHDEAGAPVNSAQHEAEEFVANIDAELAAGDDDSTDDDELSAAGPGSSELVAGPRELDD